jgi:hypothetical protein
MRPTAILFACIVVWATATGCDAPSNSAFLPVGSRCSNAAQCGTRPYTCNTLLPGGYCERDCATDGDCPMDSVCSALRCRRRCQLVSECRVNEGYTCRNTGATAFVCEAATNDAGM